MKTIVIAPYAQNLRNGNKNPKNYPYWDELCGYLNKDYFLKQVSLTGQPQINGVNEVYYGLRLKEIQTLVEESFTWLSVDSFLQHFVNIMPSRKSGIVLWSLSDPKIFGYPYNLNLLRDRKYLRPLQFQTWEEIEYNIDAFLSAKEVYDKITTYLKNRE